MSPLSVGAERTGIKPPYDRWRDLWVEVEFQAHGLRNLRANLLGFANWLARDPSARGLLVLAEPRISQERLRDELRLAETTLRPDIMHRLSVASIKDGRYYGLPTDLGSDFRVWLDGVVQKESKAEVAPARSFYSILEVLLHQRLLGRGAVTHSWLRKTVGCSYPTVAASLRRLESSLIRHSDRRVELRHFPTEEWWRLLAVADEVRSTRRFVDRSGQPRSPETMIRRLGNLGRRDIAIGGALGARHYQPKLDLVGTPRIDLSVHSRSKKVNLDFIRELDPTLREIERKDEVVVLVIHQVRRAESLFVFVDDVTWADPVECLLDLQESRLELQAQEFVDGFRDAKGELQ